MTTLCAATAMAGEAVTIDGQLHIRNSATPSQGREVMRLEELWRAGGEDDEEIILGQIIRARSDADGNVYLLDAQLKQVLVYSPAGELLRTVCREGEGPGELRRPFDLVLLPDGHIGVIEGFPGGVVAVDQRGVPAGEWGFRLSRGTQFAAANCRAGHLVVGMVASSRDDATGNSRRNSVLASFSGAGEEVARFLESPWEFNYASNYVFDEEQALVDFVWSFDVGPDGRVYAPAARNRYAISVFNPDGTLDRIIEREFTSRPRTATEMARINALTERRFRTFPFELTLEIESTEPDINWLHRGIQVADDGTLWVRHSRSAEGRPEGILLSFDLFDADGHFTRQVDLECPGESLHDMVFLLGGDRVLQIRGFVDAMRTVFGGGQGGFTGEEDPAVPEVICYAIRR